MRPTAQRSIVLISAALIAACAPAASTPTADTELAIDAMRVLSADDMQGRRVGTPGSTKARQYIAAEAMTLSGGMTPEEHGFSRGRVDRSGDTVQMTGTNLILTLPGKDPAGPILEITAHYDHMGVDGDTVFNGADDNASGVAALLAILRSFRDTPPDHEVRLIWLDTEEFGLVGAYAYVDRQQDTRPRVNMNLDMISQNQEGRIYMAGSYHTPALRPLIEQAADTVNIEVKYGHDSPEDGADDWTNQSDHGAFHDAGIPFVYFGVEDHTHYHKVTDTFDTIPLDFYREAVQLTVNTAHVLDENLDAIAKPKTTSTAP